MKKLNQGGQCRSCNANLVDWERVQKKDLSDTEYTFRALKLELIRHHFWHQDFDEQALVRAYRQGMAGLRAAAPKRIRTALGKAEPFRDGTQTPLEGNVLFYAQHATATCCRKCAEYWHGIPRGRVLTEAEIRYLSNLVVRYVEDRLPNLPEDGLPIRLTVSYRGGQKPRKER